MTDHPLGEEPFPNVQSELALTQLHSIPSCPIAGHQREEISTSPSAAPLEKGVDCNASLGVRKTLHPLPLLHDAA